MTAAQPNFSLGDASTLLNDSGYLSDGDTIPYVITATDVSASNNVPGAVIERFADLQAIGIITQVSDPDANASTVTSTAAAEDDRVELRISGLFYAEFADAEYEDGERLQWDTTAKEFIKDTTGAHQCVGGVNSGDEAGWARINIYPAAKGV